MKTLILAIMLATVTLAQAQQPNMPRTIKLHNNATGEPVGTITMSGNSAYLRNKDGEHIYTIVRGPNGTRTIYDPNGKEVDEQALKLSLPKLPE